jgi:hypothetical protein
MIENDLINKPGHIETADGTGFQMTKKLGKVIAIKGAWEIYRLSTEENGESITLVAKRRKISYQICVFLKAQK